MKYSFGDDATRPENAASGTGVQPERTHPMPNAPPLIAHRGWPARHPENGLRGFAAAAAAGARYLELDVQLSADRVPLVIHDDNLRRTTGVDMSILETRAAMLRSMVDDPAMLPTLAETMEWIATVPGLEVFVELKRASLRRFGVARVIESLGPALRPAISRCVIISFAAEALRHARDALGTTIGWVLDGPDSGARAQAEALAPGYLFVEQRGLRGSPPWDGPWRWVAYTVNDPDRARELLGAGMDLVETDDVGAMIEALAADGPAGDD